MIKGENDSLNGYEKSEIEIEGEVYPFIVPNKNGQVMGLIVELTKDELEKTDEYEGDEYKREKVILESGVSVWVYIKT